MCRRFQIEPHFENAKPVTAKLLNFENSLVGGISKCESRQLLDPGPELLNMNSIVKMLSYQKMLIWIAGFYFLFAILFWVVAKKVPVFEKKFKANNLKYQKR